MQILKPIPYSVFDNLYSKPAQLGLPANATNSMTVLFSVDNIIYYGQYNFTTGYWQTIPDDEKGRKFKDRCVQYWFYLPNSVDTFKQYAEDVKAGKCTDTMTRLDEYDETDKDTHLKWQ